MSSFACEMVAVFAGETRLDPIVAGLRDRIRGLIEEVVEHELEAALGSGRCERAGGTVGHRTDGSGDT